MVRDKRFSVQVSSMKAQGGVELIFEIMFAFMMFAISGYVLYIFFAHVPVSPGVTATHAATNWVFAFFDSSFFILILLGILIDLVASFRHPSESKVIANIVGLFILGYISTTAGSLILPLVNATNSTGILPITTAFIQGNFRVFVIFVSMVASIILNLYGLHHGHKGEGGSKK